MVKKLIDSMKRHYDKLVFVVILLSLMGSLIYLAVRVGMIQSDQRKFDEQIAGMRPAHETVDRVVSVPYEQALELIRQPRSLGFQAWSNALFVPEVRVMCVDCRRPIPFKNDQCPFCFTQQPPEDVDRPDYDGDSDGLRDSWEIEHGLDPRDPRDAMLDADGDGFSNLAEFRGKTKPNDPKSYPPPEAELYLEKVDAQPFMLRFKSASKMPDKSLRFQLNLAQGQKTYFASLGQEIEGFVVAKYEPIIKEEKTGNMVRKRDVSILTLRRGDKEIPLVRNEDVPWNEHTAHFLFNLDGTRFAKKRDETFKIKDVEYQVISVDSKTEKVIIRRLHDGWEMEVGKYPDAPADGAGGTTDQGGVPAIEGEQAK